MSAVTDISGIAAIKCPDSLRDLPVWLLWRFEIDPNRPEKPLKVPYYATGAKRSGVQGRPEDLAKLTTFDAAKRAAARFKFDGVGIAPNKEVNLVILDFDNCVKQGRVHDGVMAVIADTYAELSPSGNGVHAIYTGKMPDRKDTKHPEFGFEVFCQKGFVTFTGNVLEATAFVELDNTVASVSHQVQQLYAARFTYKERPKSEFTESSGDPVGLTEAKILEVLAQLDPDAQREEWLRVGMALHHETRGEGINLYDDWSARGSKYVGFEDIKERWDSFGKNPSAPVTMRTLMKNTGMSASEPASAEEFETVAEEIRAAGDAPKAKGRFTPVSLADFAGRPPPEWVIKGVLPKAGLVVLYGESGSGKSFMALDMAAAIARGIQWRGRRVKQGRVVYIAAEGAGGFRNRCVAYLQVNGLDAGALPLEIIPDSPNLLKGDEALALARAIGPADVVVVDTFAQVTPGGNENAGEDMGKALKNCAGIHRATGAVVLLVHHSGKDASKGARGWSGIKAAADAELEVTKSAAGRAMRTSKMKDGEDDLVWGFALDTVGIGADADGDPITSCTVVEAAVPVGGVSLKPLGVVEAIVNAVIQEMAQSQNTGIEVPAVIIEAAKRMEAPTDGKRDTRRMRARRALLALCDGDESPYFLEGQCLSIT